MAPFRSATALACFKQFVRRRQHHIGSSLARIAYGLWLLSFYAQSFPIRHFIWGNLGPISYDIFRDEVRLTGVFSVLTYSASPMWLDTCYYVAVFCALLVTFGLFTRPSIVISLVLLWSFHARNGYILDGGDNIGRIVLLFLIFMDCSTFFSLDSLLGPKRANNDIRTIVHNAGFYAIFIQLCLLYLTSGLSKVTGPLWQNGTAIYYVLKSNNFSRG